MIAFTCSHCGKGLRVNADRAGKTARCPSCKQAITIPAVVPARPVPAGADRAGPAAPEGGTEAATLGPALPDARHDTLAGAAGRPAEGAVRREWTAFLAPAAAPDELGRLGSYRVLKVLGAGGMGVVYQAEDPHLQRPVALKAILPSLGASSSARQRFLREARAAAALKHDHVVTIYQVSEDRGVPFLAMEFLEGESLEACLHRQGKLPIAEALRVGREIAAGLAAAHRRGLIHRDIKPANVWLEAETGRVKILDFGLARGAGDDTQLTQEGAILGTPAYMAPEQAHGQPVDARCDLFSLGCVLYRACTGALPFQGSDVVSILVAVATAAPQPLGELNSEMPPALSDLVLQLLQKNPADRPASAEAVVAALRALESDRTAIIPAVPAAGRPAPRGFRWALMVLGAGMLAVLAVGWFALCSPPEDPVPAPPPVLVTQQQPAPPPPRPRGIDLLASINRTRDRVAGKWKFAEGKLYGEGVQKKGDYFFLLHANPPPAYRLHLRIRCVRPWPLWIGIASGSGRAELAFMTRYLGLSLIDKVDINDRHKREAVRHPTKVLGSDPVRLVCTVSPKKVEVKCDDDVVYGWKGDFERHLSRWDNHPKEPLYVGGYGVGAFVFEEIILEPLAPKASGGSPKGSAKARK